MTILNAAEVWPSVALVGGLLIGSGEAATAAGTARDAYVQSIKQWHADRLEKLTAEDGWLTLIGLFWLEDGSNAIGSDASAKVRLPADQAPPRVGIITIDGERLHLMVAPGVDVRHADQFVDSIALLPDTAPDPTVLELGDLTFFVIRRGGRYAVRVRDRNHPARRQFAGIETFAVDPGWRIEARLERYDPPRMIPIPNVLGTVEALPSPGALVFERNDRRHRLDALEGSDDRLFVVFADETSGHETYGGGRFVDSEPLREDGSVVLDFNKAYNPPCAFTDFATCPLPPRQNRLSVRVEAGEKSRGRHH